MIYHDVKLPDNTTVRVYMPPTVKIQTVVSKMHPYPEMPTVQISVAVPKGEEPQFQEIGIEDDPVYLAEKAKVTELRYKESEEWTWLFALRDLKVPDGFDVTIYAELALLENPDWKPREGERGRKLDYIEWEFFGNHQTAYLIQMALNDMMTISEEFVAANEATF